MISFYSLWLLLAATPLLAKSIGHNPDASAATSRSSTDRFLQIAHKSCLGPHNQLGTCMFNFECQKQRGQVVGACLDGFLFGACCHQSEENDDQTSSSTTPQIIDHHQNISSNLTWRVPSVETIPNNSIPDEDISSPQLPLVLMFLNSTKSSTEDEKTSSSTEQHQQTTTMPVLSSISYNNKIPDAGSEEFDEGVTNQISPLETTSTTTSSSSSVLNQQDPVLQAQLEALLNAHTEATINTTTRNPNRKPSSGKRPRPKPSSTTTEATTTPTTTTTESLAEMQANVLQFLVSNPPAWVLDEIINGSTMTTWFPLPIPDSLPGTVIEHESPIEAVVTPSPPAPSTLRPPKRKPGKTRPTVPSRSGSSSTATVQASETTELSSSATATTTTTSEATTTTTKKPRPIFDYHKDCGVRPMVPEARIVGGRRSDYGRWPWQVLIRESTWFGIFSKNKCGGVLISDRHVLTAAHCQPGFLGSLLVVLGEFDLTGHSEPNTPTEKNVKRVVVHRDYVERTFENDLAILELETPVEFKPYIVPICLPSTSDGDFTTQKAEVTGWGKLSHNGPTPGVLYEVDVPIMSNPECHDMFKKAGHEKRILDSFVCAGYAEGKKDSCEGDSGGPLMVERDDGRWTLVGTVSHGIRCAYPNMPGVYMRMTYYRPWIERVTGIGGTQLG